MLPGPYNSNYQIVQVPGYVIIEVEMIHDARIIPLDRRPHLPQNVRSWLGDSLAIGKETRWSSTRPIFGLTPPIEIQFPKRDPSTFTRPWTAALPMTKIPGPLYEYACHEGNYAMEGILAGARAQEKEGK